MGGELIETEFGLAKAPGTEGAEPKALCHPLRRMFADGLCETCCTTRELAMKPFDATTGAPIGRTEADRAAALDLYRTAEYVRGLANAAEAILHHHLPEYASLHIEAARVAAKDGDAGPAQWALQHLKPAGKAVVDLPPKAGPGGSVGGAGGAQIMIGIQVGQLPAGAVKAEVVQMTDGEVIE